MPATANGPDLEQARATLESLMDDEVAIARPTGGEVLDPNTGKNTPEATISIYTGPALISTPRLVPEIRERAGNFPTYMRQKISVPVTANEVLKGDVVTCTASRRLPQMVGEVWRVEGVLMGTFALKQTLLVTQP